MMGEPVRWSDEAQEVISGDITTAVAYLTPAGGAVVTPVATFGIADRDRGMVGFTTSLGFPRKLERIIADPRVALAYHAREHGFSALPWFVLAQGRASVNLQPSRERVEAIIPQAERYYGAAKRGPVWDRLLREYYYVRVFADVAVERILAWPSLDATGDPQVADSAWPGPPAPQRPPANGTGPRVDVDRAAGQIGMLAHRLLAYRAATDSRSWSRSTSPGMTRRPCARGCSGAAPARGPPCGPARPRLPGPAGRAEHPGLHRLAGSDQRRRRRLCAPHLEGLRGAAAQEPAAGL